MHPETDEQKRKKVFDFIKRHHIGVLSTVNQKHLPEAAVVGFDKDEIARITKIQLPKIPSAAKYVRESHEAFFKIQPSWIRYSDLSVDPWHVCEINFLK